MDDAAGSIEQSTPQPYKPRRTARWAVVQELKRRGTARNRDLSRDLNLKPSTVGYILYQLRITGCANRIDTGVYEFVRVPENLN